MTLSSAVLSPTETMGIPPPCHTVTSAVTQEKQTAYQATYTTTARSPISK